MTSLKEAVETTQEIEFKNPTGQIVRNKFSNSNILGEVTPTIHVPQKLSNLNKEDTTQTTQIFEIIEASIVTVVNTIKM